MRTPVFSYYHVYSSLGQNTCRSIVSDLTTHFNFTTLCCCMKFAEQLSLVKSRKENPQKLTQLSSRSHPRHLVGKRTAQKDTIIDITSDSQVNSNFPYRWSPARYDSSVSSPQRLLFPLNSPDLASLHFVNRPCSDHRSG